MPTQQMPPSAAGPKSKSHKHKHITGQITNSLFLTDFLPAYRIGESGVTATVTLLGYRHNPVHVWGLLILTT